MNKSTQLTILKELEENNLIVPNDWLIKFENYNFDLYTSDIERHGIKTTWLYICKYVLSCKKTVDFLNISNLGELYETALAINDKQQKKNNGQYYTPNDVASVMSGWLKVLNSYNVCDVACGTGKLILTYLELIGKKEAITLLNSNRIYLYDNDEVALAICVASILAKYGIQYSNNINICLGDFLDKNLHLPSNCKVISNPPYSRFSATLDSWENTKIQHETKELYAAFMEKIISESECSVIITPYSFIGGSKFYPLRELMNNYTGFIVSFDNVPGNIFYGKKHGVFNTNTSNSVRAAITVVQGKTQDTKGFRLSHLIRFKNEERDKLLNCKILESTLSNKYQIVNKNNSAYIKCKKELQDVFDSWINNSKNTLKDLLSTKTKILNLFIPNTCRYYTTASSYKLKRTGMITLSFEDEKNFNFVYCLINSSFAYWWWRIFDGGITYSVSLLHSLPTFMDSLTEDDHNFFNKTSKDMIKHEKEYIVTKMNAGSIQENIKFPAKYRNKINQRFLKILGFENFNAELFDNLHTNNFWGDKNDN